MDHKFPNKHRSVYIQKDTLSLICAVTSGRTMTPFSKRHYCKKHQKVVDKKHIDSCSLINDMGPPTKYNLILERLQWRNIPSFTAKHILIHFGWMQARIEKLEEEKSWMTVTLDKNGKAIIPKSKTDSDQTMSLS